MSRFADLGRRLAAADDCDHEDETDVDPSDKGAPSKSKSRKENEMTEAEHQAALEQAKKEARAEGFKSANDRSNAVMASEHYKGREALAANLLKQEAMTAEAIISALADAPKAAANDEQTEEQRKAAKDAAEEGGRQEMKEQLGKQGNSDIEADSCKGGKGGKVDATAVWDKALAKVTPKKRGA